MSLPPETAPPPIEAARINALKKLAANHFGKITPAEEKVIELSASTINNDAKDRGERPEVRAAFLRWLITDAESAAHIDPAGVRVDSSTITSILNLDFCKIPFRIRLGYCTLNGDLSLIAAEIPGLQLLSCSTSQDIVLDFLRTESSVYLNFLQSQGNVRLAHAQIAGDLCLFGASLTATDKALQVDAARIAGNVFLTPGSPAIGAPYRQFSSSGNINFVGAEIGGSFECLEAAIGAMKCDMMRVKGSLMWIRILQSCVTDLSLAGASVGTLRDDRDSWPAKGHLHILG
jgi:hypothetical protein